MFPFEHLVFDIQHYIITLFVPSHDLYSLALVSKSMNSVAMPALYRHVRLLPGLAFRFKSPHLSGAHTKNLSLAQQSFATQIASSSSSYKAEHVRFLEWHMSSYGVAPRQAFLEIFPRLRYLQKLRIINAHPTNMTELSLLIPPLFPHLKEISIGGITHLPFILPILHTSHHLRVVTVDAPSPHSVHLQLLQWLATHNLENLEKLTLRASLPADGFKIDEILDAWNQILYAVRNSVEEVVLGFRTLRENQACTEEEQQMFSMKFVHRMSSVFSPQIEWRRLKRISLMGVSLPDEDTTSLPMHFAHILPRLTSHILDETPNSVDLD